MDNELSALTGGIHPVNYATNEDTKKEDLKLKAEHGPANNAPSQQAFSNTSLSC